MDLEDLLKEYTGRNVSFLLNASGNRGDGLLRLGRRSLFAKHAITCREFVSPEETGGEILFVEGSGAFSKDWNHQLDSVSRYLTRFNRIVLMPTTFEMSHPKIREFIRSLPGHVLVYCREKYSFNEVIRQAPHKENILLNNDSAFYADYSAWRKTGKGILIAFREDKEKNADSLANLRRKCLKALLVFRPDKTFLDVAKGKQEEYIHYLDTISRYSEIHTDRAHVAIAASLMGKKTYIYSCRYPKVKAIYEYSLSHLPNVRWVG